MDTKVLGKDQGEPDTASTLLDIPDKVPNLHLLICSWCRMTGRLLPKTQDGLATAETK